MSMDDDGDDDAAGRVPPPAPDDRLWRHPSEVSEFGGGRVPPPVAPVPAAEGRSPVWPIALVAGFVGAALCGGVLAVTGQLSVDPEQVIERVNVTPNVPSNLLSDPADFDALKDKVSPSVVRLAVKTGDVESHACGVLVRDDGVVLTSAHEVAGATTITVRLADGRQMEGHLVGVDLPTDVGVVTIAASDLTVAVLGSTDDLEPGETTMAICANKEGQAVVSTGVISALGRRLDVDGESLHGLIQTDAPIESAWSGGPLVDATGAVIGITTDLAGDQSQFGFATPIDLMRGLADELLASGKVTHGWLGVEMADLTDEEAEAIGFDGGAEVHRVMPGSPADASGLSEGDVITAFGGIRVRSSSDLVVALRWHKPGDVVLVRYLRDGHRHEVDVTIERVP
jgi:S1-C subfamily serine protease